jgi:hypothetical protein
LAAARPARRDAATRRDGRTGQEQQAGSRTDDGEGAGSAGQEGAQDPADGGGVLAGRWSSAAATGDFVAARPRRRADLFAPRLYINDQVITEYEVIQRALFLKLLRAPAIRWKRR